MSPDLNARFDQQRYQTGCHKLMNMVPMPTGGITKRPGWQALAARFAVDDTGDGSTDSASRLIPFIFSANESRMLEFSTDIEQGAVLRVWRPDGTAIGPDIFFPEWLGRHNLEGLSWCQSGDVIFLAHRTFPPLKLCRYSDTDWRLEKIDWLPGIEPPQDISIERSGDPGVWRPNNDKVATNYRYVVTAVDAATGEESVPSAEVSREDAPLGTNGYGLIIRIGTPVENALEYRVYRYYNGIFGFIGRIEGNAEDLTFEDVNILPDTEDTPPTARDPFVEAWQWPGVVFLHQQRLGYASTVERPMTIWMSQSGNFESMAASVPPRDDDAIEATLAANQCNRILWCASDRSGLAIGTEGGEWTLTNGAEGAATPSEISFNPQSWYGSHQTQSVEVLRAGSALVFAQRGGFAVREFAYSFNNDRYESADLAVLARHILNNNSIYSWTWQPEPYGIIWIAQVDGGFASISYMRDHDVVAWARHMTDGWIESLASIPDETGLWQVWAIIHRWIMDNGRRRKFRFVERLRPFYNNLDGEFPADAHLDGPNDATFEARCIPCLPDAGMQDGTSFLRVRKINAVKIRVMDCAPFMALVHGQGIPDSPVRNVPERPGEFSHEPQDWACPLAAGFRDDPRIELIMDGTAPATILGLTVSLEFAEQGLGQK